MLSTSVNLSPNMQPAKGYMHQETEQRKMRLAMRILINTQLPNIRMTNKYELSRNSFQRNSKISCWQKKVRKPYMKSVFNMHKMVKWASHDYFVQYDQLISLQVDLKLLVNRL